MGISRAGPRPGADVQIKEKKVNSMNNLKRRRFKKTATLALALALCAGTLPAAAFAAEDRPVESSNRNREDYTVWSQPVTSYLYDNGSGVTRVEYTGGQVVVEDYDSSFSYLSGRSIAPELPIWGGFYAGSDYNFLIFGQNNPSESDSVEVIRVVKYDKNWNRLGTASLRGANTTVPFDAGSLRCDEYGGYLYIRTSHEMYKYSGVNHQANLTMAVRQRDMAVTDSYCDIWNSDYGYVSHSFNQFLIVDEEGRIVTLDHGDSSPRSVVFMRYYADASTGKFSGSTYGRWCSVGDLQTFAGDGSNATGASVGGLAETGSAYVFAYNYNPDGKSVDGRYPVLHYMDIATGRSWQVKINLPGCTTPMLAPTGLDGGYMLWNGKSGYTVGETLYYVPYGADGKPGDYETASAPLSDCQPIAWKDGVLWYVTDNSTPTFYTLDGSGVKSYPTSATTQTTPTPAPTPEPTPAPTPEPALHSVTAASQAGGSISLSASGAKAGEVVAVTLVPAAGYATSGCSVRDSAGQTVAVKGSGSQYTFIMPDAGVTVSAVFQPQQPQQQEQAPQQDGDLRLRGGYTTLVPYGKYTQIGAFREGMAEVWVETNEVSAEGYQITRYGFIDETGKEVIPCRYVPFPYGGKGYDNDTCFHDGLARVWNGDNNWSFIDKTGKTVLTVDYYYVSNFYNGLAMVDSTDTDGCSFGLIDKTGREVVAPDGKYDWIYNDEGWKNLVIVSAYEGDGVVDRTGREILPCVYENVYEDEYGGLVAYLDYGECGYFDATGRQIIPCQYKRVRRIAEDRFILENNKQRVALADENGDALTPFQYTSFDRLSDGLLCMSLDGPNVEYIDMQGNVILRNAQYGEPFHDGLARIEKKDPNSTSAYGGWLYGYMDKTGREVIPCQYYSAGNFSEGLSAVSTSSGGKYGYIDTAGRMVIPAVYSTASGFENGIAEVKRTDADGTTRSGFIDKTGKEVLFGCRQLEYDLSTGLVTIENENQEISLIKLHLVTEDDMVGNFADVLKSDWHAQAVQWAVERNITAGTSATTFSPDATCTQGEILTLLWRAVGSPAPAQTPVGSEFYAAPAQWAKEQGLTGAFSAGAPCTRAMVVSYLWRLAGSPAASGGQFTDVATGADYAQAVAWAVSEGITSGTGNGLFSPNMTCTRSQIVTFLYRYFA